jgi:SAM-dependent methyltransferase
LNLTQVDTGELEAIYDERFNAHITYRAEVWRVLVNQFFSNLIRPTDTVLDLGCGYGEFINHVNCQKKYGMDLNSRARKRLKPDVTFLEQDCSTHWALPDNTLDVVFTSNFFEHLFSKQALADTLAQARRCLKPGGRLMALGPNIRFVGGAYWDFWDHHLALTDLSLAEIVRVQNFQIERVVDRFLPYTMVNRRLVPSALVSLYLRVPFLWSIFGKQFLVQARKPE